MKTAHLVRLAGAILTVLSIGTAYAQTAASASAPAADATSGKTPKQQMRAANRQLEKQVRHALTKTKGLVSSAITIFAKNGFVTLVGTVPEQDQIQLAGDAASKVSGVTGVKNNIVLYEAAN